MNDFVLLILMIVLGLGFVDAQIMGYRAEKKIREGR
jgi:hypothetical protein